jgi:hypothetical protein
MSDIDRILSLAGLATAGVAKETVARELKDVVEAAKPESDLDEADISEAAERPYVCVHAKKGKHSCTAGSSYEAAQKAAKAWGLKSTAGIDAHLADVKHVAEENKDVNEGAGWCGVCGNDVCTCTDIAMESDCDCDDEEETLEEMEVVSEAPTMDTTQLINLMRLSGINEETIKQKLDEWANTPEGVGEVEPTAHGDAYDFAQSVNLSLKRYLDAEDMKVQVKEHTVENMKALYEAKKNTK